jgi:hypothetical protein
MDKGPIHSAKYAEKLSAYVKVKKTALAEHSTEHDRRGKERDFDRRIKIETVMENVSSCTCRWLPSMQRWTNRCAGCIRTKAIYCHDRGLTRLHEFRKKGIQVYVPDKKVANQTCWSKQSTRKDRNIAMNRIHVERNNQELRRDDGFHGQRETKQIYLATALGEVSRLNANLNPVLHILAKRSTQGVIELSDDDVEGGTSDMNST